MELYLDNEVSFQMYLGFHWRVFHKIHTSHSSLVRYKICNFGYVWSVINGILLEEQRVFLVVYQLPLEGFS